MDHYELKKSYHYEAFKEFINGHINGIMIYLKNTFNDIWESELKEITILIKICTNITLWLQLDTAIEIAGYNIMV
jgi:GH15 family glucan-1,4-alpha-glucosidase